MLIVILLVVEVLQHPTYHPWLIIVEFCNAGLGFLPLARAGFAEELGFLGDKAGVYPPGVGSKFDAEIGVVVERGYEAGKKANLLVF